MSKKNIDLHERMASLEASFKSYIKSNEEKNHKMDNILLGNGQPGLVERFNKSEGFFKGFAFSISALFAALVGYLTFFK